MYAIIENGGKQYKVEEGSKFVIDQIPDAIIGQRIIIDRVLLVVSDDKKAIIGQPIIKGVNVTAIVLSKKKFRKIIIFKKKPKKGYKKTQGHRQHVMELQVVKINLNNTSIV
jgi:large subunit ribosomal protein L21